MEPIQDALQTDFVIGCALWFQLGVEPQGNRI